MAAKKRAIKINRKKKEPEVKEVTLEEALEEMEDVTIPEQEGRPMVEEATPVSTVVENEISDVQTVGLTRSQLKGEIVGNGTHTVVKQPKGRIRFEAQVAAVPLFKLPEDIRRYLISNGLPTTIWQWDKEKLEKRKVNLEMVEKLKKFLSSM